MSLLKSVLLGAALAVAIPATLPAQAPRAVANALPRAGDYALDKSHAKLMWSTSHFGFSTYTGQFTRYDMKLRLDPANPARSNLTATIDLTSVDTRDAALDSHLAKADFFESAKYPTATFRSTRIVRTGPNRARVTGDLSLRGVTRPVNLDVRFNKAAENPMSKTYVVGFDAEGIVQRSRFGMSFGVPAIGDEVKLSFSGEFNPAR